MMTSDEEDWFLTQAIKDQKEGYRYLWIKNFAITEDFYILSGLIRDKWDDFIDRRIGELDE